MLQFHVWAKIYIRRPFKRHHQEATKGCLCTYQRMIGVATSKECEGIPTIIVKHTREVTRSLCDQLKYTLIGIDEGGLSWIMLLMF